MAERHLNVSETELLAELETMLTPEGEGLRTVEVAQTLNICRNTALRLLKMLDERGHIERVRKQVVKFDGRQTTTTAYRLKSVEEGQEDDD